MPTLSATATVTIEEPEPGGPPAVAPEPRYRWLWEAILILTGYALYEMVRSKVAGNPIAAYHHGLQIVHAERLLHIYWERPIQHAFIGDVRFLQFWDIYYGTVHFVMPVIALAWLFHACPPRYRRWRNALVWLTLISIAGFALYPLMPPRLMPASYAFVDTAARFGGLGVLDKGSMKDVENLYAAMPSLHLAWSTWSALALFGAVRRPWVKALVLLDPLLTTFAVVVTANHWILDCVAGLLVLGLGHALARGIDAGAAWVRRPRRLPR